MQKLLLSTAYLPPIDYMALVSAARAVEIEIHETYAKQSYRNRCRIAAANGILDLIIPVKQAQGNHTKTKDIYLDLEDNWRARHWRAIKSAYNPAPYFLHYADELEILFTNDPIENLTEWNHRLLMYCLEALNIQVQIRFSSSFKALETSDMRYRLHPKKSNLSERYPAYHQVFHDRIGFVPNLSILDLLFNVGPEAGPYLAEIRKGIQS